MLCWLNMNRIKLIWHTQINQNQIKAEEMFVDLQLALQQCQASAWGDNIIWNISTFYPLNMKIFQPKNK